jgi:hypothetical protein
MKSAQRRTLDRWLVRIALPSASRPTCPEVVQGDIDAKTGNLDPRLRQSFQETGQSLQFARI